jgi:hypothetical protein
MQLHLLTLVPGVTHATWWILVGAPNRLRNEMGRTPTRILNITLA